MPKRVTVKWLDAASNAKWVTRKGLPTPVRVTSRGFLGTDKRKYLTVCATYAPELKTFGDCISIPQGMVSEVVYDA